MRKLGKARRAGVEMALRVAQTQRRHAAMMMQFEEGRFKRGECTKESVDCAVAIYQWTRAICYHIELLLEP